MTDPTLKAFYYGNLSPCEKQIIRGSEAERLAKELSDAGEQLARSLPPDLRPVLDQLLKAQDRLDGLMAAEHYVDGFKTGARFMMEILDDAHGNLKPITE